MDSSVGNSIVFVYLKDIWGKKCIPITFQKEIEFPLVFKKKIFPVLLKKNPGEMGGRELTRPIENSVA